MLRTTTGIESGPDAIDKSRFIIIFLNILVVTKICSFRLVLEGRAGDTWIFKIRVLRKVFSKQFSLSDAEDNNSALLNRRGIADLRTLLAIDQKSHKSNFWEVMDSFVLLAYASLAASRSLSQELLASLNFTLDSEDLFC